MVGCLASTFYLLETFGTRKTLWRPRPSTRSSSSSRARSTELGRTEPEAAPPAGGDAAQARRRLVRARRGGVVGFAFFLMELVWYRMLGPLLGGSVFTFGLIFAVALLGIGVGGLLYALVGGNRPRR